MNIHKYKNVILKNMYVLIYLLSLCFLSQVSQSLILKCYVLIISCNNVAFYLFFFPLQKSQINKIGGATLLQLKICYDPSDFKSIKFFLMFNTIFAD